MMRRLPSRFDDDDRMAFKVFGLAFLLAALFAIVIG